MRVPATAARSKARRPKLSCGRLTGSRIAVATVYDGKELRNYVDGVQEGAAQVHLAPHGPGRSSVGVRINKVFYFKGAVHLARFTRKALSPSEFLTPPVFHRKG